MRCQWGGLWGDAGQQALHNDANDAADVALFACADSSAFIAFTCILHVTCCRTAALSLLVPAKYGIEGATAEFHYIFGRSLASVSPDRASHFPTNWQMSALSRFKRQMSDKAATKTFYAPLCPAIHNLYVANKSAPGDRLRIACQMGQTTLARPSACS